MLAFCAALAAGCGFVGEEPFAGRRAPDVAPWEDLGPVTFCDGALRLGTPARDTAGLCATTPPRACRSDRDCASRERCTCAGCQVALCDGDDECGPHFVCSLSDRRCDRPCATDGDCPARERCLPGRNVCRGDCAGDGDCQTGERCEAGRCIATPCARDLDCDDACALQRKPATLREPSPLRDGARVILYLERDGATWRATSDDDGLRFRFDPAAPVLAGRSPSVLRTAQGFLAAFAADRTLRRATSADGIAFTVDDAPLLAPSTDWDTSGLDAPALAPGPRGGVLLYYGTVARDAIGLAASDDGTTFAADPAPVLTPASVAHPRLWRELDAIASPFAETARTVDGKPLLRLWFAARGRESDPSIEFGMPVEETPNFSIGAASTLDGRALVPWPWPPAFDRVQNFLRHVSESEPAVVELGPSRLLYYRGAAADDSRPTNLGAARNPVEPR